MGYRYRIWDIDIDSGCGLSIWDMVSTWAYTHHIDMVILDIDMGYGLMKREMTVSILSSWISIWDILSLWCLFAMTLVRGALSAPWSTTPSTTFP